MVVLMGSTQAQSIDLLKLPIMPLSAREVPKSPPMGAPVETLPETLVTEFEEVPESQDDFTGKLGIAETNLSVALKSFGAAYPDSSAIPADIWRGSDARTLRLLMGGLKPGHGPGLSILLRDVLLAEAALPIQESDAKFLQNRAMGLAQLGMGREALRLLDAAPDLDARSQSLFDQLQLRNFNHQSLCPRPTQQRETLLSQKLDILCLLLAQKPREAALRTQLLQEVAPQTREDGFVILISLILLQESTLPPETTIMPEAIHLVLARWANIMPRFPDGASLAPDVARMLLELPGVELDTRLDYAETAYGAGYASVTDVQRMQLAMSFSAVERENAAQLLMQFPSSKSRALVAQVLADNPRGSETSDIVEAALQHGDQAGLYDLMLDILTPTLRRGTSEQSLPLARAFLALQDFPRARQALPSKPSTLQGWLLKTILTKEAEVPLVQNDIDFLQSLIIEDDQTVAPETANPWQDWYDAFEREPERRAQILALLPSLGVASPMASDPTPFALLDDSTRHGEALLTFAIWLAAPNVALDAGHARTALHGLERLGYGALATVYAAHRLAGLLRPIS